MIIEKYNWKDIDHIVDLVEDIWHLDKMYDDPKLGHILSKEYLLSVCKHTTDIYVSKIDGEIIGFLFLSMKDHEKLHIPEDVLKKLESKTGENVEIFKNMIDEYYYNCKNLLKKTGIDFDSEVVLFAVSTKYQNKGIGSQLFNKALEIFKQNNYKNYFLYTDTSCNYEYYERLNMKRLASYSSHENFEIYIYGGLL